MAPASPDAPRPALKVPGTRASSVIVHLVPPECVDRFLAWENGIIQAAADFPGYQETDIYPPAEATQREWVVVIHFDNAAALQRWLDAPQRRKWTENLPSGIGGFTLKTLPTGFGPWFAGLLGDHALPPAWKMALTVLLGLYPTVMLLNILLVPHISHLGLALAVLAGNAVSVVILQWVVMPALEFVLRPWFHATGSKGRALSLGGLAAILVLLGAMALLFQQLTG